MTEVAQIQIGGSHALTVVCDLDFFLSTLFNLDLNSGCSGVDCVLYKFLDSRCWALNDLASSNFIDDFIG